VTRRKPSQITTGRLQSLRLFSTLLAIVFIERQNLLTLFTTTQHLGPELRAVSGQRNESQPQEDQSSKKAHQPYTS